jgi:hypothetical protein
MSTVAWMWPAAPQLAACIAFQSSEANNGAEHSQQFRHFPRSLAVSAAFPGCHTACVSFQAYGWYVFSREINSAETASWIVRSSV